MNKNLVNILVIVALATLLVPQAGAGGLLGNPESFAWYVGGAASIIDEGPSTPFACVSSPLSVGGVCLPVNWDSAASNSVRVEHLTLPDPEKVWYRCFAHPTDEQEWQRESLPFTFTRDDTCNFIKVVPDLTAGGGAAGQFRAYDPNRDM